MARQDMQRRRLYLTGIEESHVEGEERCRTDQQLERRVAVAKHSVAAVTVRAPPGPVAVAAGDGEDARVRHQQQQQPQPLVAASEREP